MKILQNTNKGFTLVELIIVITILAILGTIGFVSFQGYTSDARDTKRTTDLSSLISSLEAKRAGNSLSLISFVDSTVPSIVTASPVNIAGQDAGLDTTLYNAGIMKFSLLGISAESFKDPNDFDYSFGATTLKRGQYQFSAVLENGETPTAVINGNYAPRIAANTLTTGTVSARSTTKFEISSTDDYSKLIVGDTVTNGANTYIIKSISSDLKYITTDVAMTTGTTTLELVSDEIGGLIGDYNTATGSGTSTPVIDGSTTTLPY